jgi:SOS regulatory protein LexA
MFLTSKQELVLKALKEYYSQTKQMPTLRELKDFLAKKKKLILKNIHSVVQYLDALEQKGLIRRGSGPRQIQLLDWEKSRFLRVPVVGWVSAGSALAIPQDSITGYLTISQNLLSRIGKNLIAVEVDGDSMNQKELKAKKIESGDFVIVDTEVKEFRNGDVVAANIEGGLTIKEFRRQDKNTIALLPDSNNQLHKPIYLTKKDEFLILGKVVDIYKKT